MTLTLTLTLTLTHITHIFLKLSQAHEHSRRDDASRDGVREFLGDVDAVLVECVSESGLV